MLEFVDSLRTSDFHIERLRRRCAVLVMPARLEHFHLGGRVAATVRSALDTESPPAHHRNCTTGVVS
jgi:hypothetical protein